MLPSDRRGFLGSSARGLAAALAAGPFMFARDDLPRSLELPKTTGEPPALDGLFLTWQRDPTTTMTIQWIGRAAPDESVAVQYVTTTASTWQFAKPTTKPFPNTNEKVFRCELTGLSP